MQVLIRRMVQRGVENLNKATGKVEAGKFPNVMLFVSIN